MNMAIRIYPPSLLRTFSFLRMSQILLTSIDFSLPRSCISHRVSKLSVDNISSKVRSDSTAMYSPQTARNMSLDRETTFDLQRHQLNSPIGEPTLTPGDIDGPRNTDHRPINGMQGGIHSTMHRGISHGYDGPYTGGNNAQFEDDDVVGAPSINGNDTMSISKRSVISGAGSLSKFADFFGPEIFQIVIHNPSTAHQLAKFSQSRFCGENMEFLDKVYSIPPVTKSLSDIKQVQKYDELINELNKTMAEIHRSFLGANAPNQINLAQPVMKKLNSSIRKTITTNLPSSTI
jgi:hypothetical protein